MVLTAPGRLLAVAVLATACTNESDAVAECLGTAASGIYSGHTAENDGGSASVLADRSRAIVAIEDQFGNLICTGIVAPPGRVLTAAHCVTEGGAIRGLARDGAEFTAPVEEAASHPDRDLAVLEVLAPGVLEREGIRRLPIRATPLGDDVTIGTRALLAGVGLTEDGGRGQLRFVEEPVTAITETTIQVDGNGKSGACEGDSGGPLLVQTPAGPEVVGVLRAGSRSCRGVDEYVRVDEQASWIRHHLLQAQACEP